MYWFNSVLDDEVASFTLPQKWWCLEVSRFRSPEKETMCLNSAQGLEGSVEPLLPCLLWGHVEWGAVLPSAGDRTKWKSLKILSTGLLHQFEDPRRCMQTWIEIFVEEGKAGFFLILQSFDTWPYLYYSAYGPIISAVIYSMEGKNIKATSQDFFLWTLLTVGEFCLIICC